MMFTYNKLIACTPFPKPQAPTKNAVVGGFALIEKKTLLQELKVVARCAEGPFSELKQQASVFVRAEAADQKWAKEVHVVDGLEFILVPESVIQLVRVEKEESSWLSGC